jgi:hypothetical protein
VTGERAGIAWTKSWTFATAKAGPSASEAVKLALARFNEARRSAGLPNVALDADLSKACQAHADYLVRNARRSGAKDISANDEDPSLPGYSLAGQQAGLRSDVFSFAPNSTTQIDDLLGTLIRRTFVLDPRLRRIGLGCALDVGQGWTSVLDLNSGRDDGDPVVYPGFGQENVPLQGRDRWRDGTKSYAGYPITVCFPGRPVIRNARATLAESTGSSVDIWLSTPDAPYDAASPQPNLIAIHPRLPLRPGRIYSVTVTALVDGVERRLNGRFSTAAD